MSAPGGDGVPPDLAVLGLHRVDSPVRVFEVRPDVDRARTAKAYEHEVQLLSEVPVAVHVGQCLGHGDLLLAAAVEGVQKSLNGVVEGAVVGEPTRESFRDHGIDSSYILARRDECLLGRGVVELCPRQTDVTSHRASSGDPLEILEEQGTIELVPLLRARRQFGNEPTCVLEEVGEHQGLECRERGSDRVDL